MDQRRAGARRRIHARRDPDLTLRRRDRAVQAEFPERARHAQDEQRLGFLRAQRAEREAVAVEQPAAAAGPRLGAHRHAGRAERIEIAVDGPDGYLQLPGQAAGGHRPAGLKQEDQADQAVGAHETRIRIIADRGCQ